MHRTQRLIAVCIAGLLCATAMATAEPIRPVAFAPDIAAAAGTQRSVLRLRLHHLHTGESIDVAYRRGSQPMASGVSMLNHFLRDWRTGEDARYPVQAFDLLHALLVKLHRPGAVIDVICGYRSPETNRALRAGDPSTGIAESSQHILSLAIDLRVPGVSLRSLRAAALSLRMGGVGFYPRSRFVHVDIGPVRSWTFGAPGYLRGHTLKR